MNNTTAYELNCFAALNLSTLAIERIVAYCLIFVVSLVGNFATALIFYETQSMKKPTNYFIANMAVSDLVFPIIVFPMAIAHMFYGSWPISGPFGEALCKLTPFVRDVSTAVSVQSLVLIAVDRFGAVVLLRFPLITPKLCPLFIFATWIIAVAVVSPFLFAFRIVEYQGKVYCLPQWKEALGKTFSFENYYLSLNVAFFCYIPLTLLIVLYSIILIKLKLQKIPGERSVNADERRARRNRAVLKMALAIVIGFALCVLPWSVINLLLLFAWDSRLPPCNMELYWRIFRLMSISNCAVNPCICYIFSSKYRQGFKKLLKCNN